MLAEIRRAPNLYIDVHRETTGRQVPRRHGVPREIILQVARSAGERMDSLQGVASARGLVPPSGPVTQPFLPKFHLPKQNWADSGTAKIKSNPTKVGKLMKHPDVSKEE